MLDYPLGALFVNGEAESALSKVKAHFVRSIQEFTPAYAVSRFFEQQTNHPLTLIVADMYPVTGEHLTSP